MMRFLLLVALLAASGCGSETKPTAVVPPADQRFEKKTIPQPPGGRKPDTQPG